MRGVRLLLVAGLVGVAACAPEPAPSDAPAPRSAETTEPTFPRGPYRYTCAESRAFEASFPSPDSAIVTLEAGTVRLGTMETGSGARYGDGTTEAWFRGLDEAFVRERETMTYTDCLRTSPDSL